MLAVLSNNIYILEILLKDRNINTELTDNRGLTALQIAQMFKKKIRNF
jgi:hypothetical protein